MTPNLVLRQAAASDVQVHYAPLDLGQRADGANRFPGENEHAKEEIDEVDVKENRLHFEEAFDFILHGQDEREANLANSEQTQEANPDGCSDLATVATRGGQPAVEAEYSEQLATEASAAATVTAPEEDSNKDTFRELTCPECRSSSVTCRSFCALQCLACHSSRSKCRKYGHCQFPACIDASRKGWINTSCPVCVCDDYPDPEWDLFS